MPEERGDAKDIMAVRDAAANNFGVERDADLLHQWQGAIAASMSIEEFRQDHHRCDLSGRLAASGQL